MPEITNGNYGQYFVPPLMSPFLGAGIGSGFESQGIGNPAQQPLFGQQFGVPQLVVQQQIAAQRKQQVAQQLQQIAAQQQQCAWTLQQLANQVATQGVIGQQTAATLQQLARYLEAQSIASQQAAMLLGQIAQQTAQQTAAQFGNAFGFGSQQVPWQQQGFGPQTQSRGLYGQYGQPFSMPQQGGAYSSGVPQQGSAFGIN